MQRACLALHLVMHRLLKPAAATILPLVALGLAGCGSEYPVAPVSGEITLNGAPLAGARVGFEPMREGDDLEAGPGSYGVTDEQGRYQLTALDGRPGAVVGNHRVWVRTYQAREGPHGQIIPVTPERVPKRYNIQTELTFEVPPGGSDEADFALSSP